MKMGAKCKFNCRLPKPGSSNAEGATIGRGLKAKPPPWVVIHSVLNAGLACYGEGIEGGHAQGCKYIAEGISECIELEHEEMYGERFDIPAPDELIFISWFQGGEVFRSGFVFNRGYGKIFYFRPGHEAHLNYYNAHIRRVIYNGIKYVAPKAGPENGPKVFYGNVVSPLEPLGNR